MLLRILMGSVLCLPVRTARKTVARVLMPQTKGFAWPRNMLLCQRFSM
jgi:hypothetical protein